MPVSKRGFVLKRLFDKSKTRRKTHHMKLPISVVIITKNESLNIERCICSVRGWVSEVLIIDSGSQDNTIKIAEKLGARVLELPWQGFGPQKRQASHLTQYDWILSLDADECVSARLRDELISRFSSLDAKTGYFFPRRSWHLGRWICHGGWYPDRQLRLFHKAYSNWNEALVHERVICPQSAEFENDIEHFVFRSLSHQVQTNDRYSTLQAEEVMARGERFSLVRLMFKPIVKFVECYVVKLGFLDGLPGFIIAVGAGYSVFLRWCKVWEKENSK